MPKVLPYVPTRKIPSSLDPVEAKFSIALFKPLGIKSEDDWRREMADIYWNCNLQHWTDKTANGVQRYVKGTVEWQLHQRFTAGSKQHLERLDNFFEKQREQTKRERDERQAEFDRSQKKRKEEIAEKRQKMTLELERAATVGAEMASLAAESPVGKTNAPWTDESKRLAEARSSPPPPRSLFGAGRKIVCVGDCHSCGSSGKDNFSPPRPESPGGYPGEETSSEKQEREAIEKELKWLSSSEFDY